MLLSIPTCSYRCKPSAISRLIVVVHQNRFLVSKMRKPSPSSLLATVGQPLLTTDVCWTHWVVFFCELVLSKSIPSKVKNRVVFFFFFLFSFCLFFFFSFWHKVRPSMSACTVLSWKQGTQMCEWDMRQTGQADRFPDRRPRFIGHLGCLHLLKKPFFFF